MAAKQIYFVRAPAAGLIKIGRTHCAVARLQSLRTMSPVPLELLGIMLCEEDGALEQRLHAAFADERAHGEWFRASKRLLAFIRENAREARPKRQLSLVERRERATRKRDLRRAKEVLAAKDRAERALADYLRDAPWANQAQS